MVRAATPPTTASFLPGDALYEILLRVPARPLCRFRTVCRSWRSLLSDPPFVAAHAARQHRDPLFAVCDAGGEGAGIKILDTSGRVVKRDSAWPHVVRRMHPHLDLVLIHGRNGVENRPLRVLDPATGAVSVLPSHSDPYSSFVFGKSVSSAGADGEYKILSISGLHHGTKFCEVLTIDGSGGGSHGTWRAAPSPPDAVTTFHGGTLAANGVVYHLAAGNNWTIAAFDLEAEQWRPSLLHGPMHMSSFDDDSRTRRSLAEVNGRLAAVYSTVSGMDIWLLMGSGEPALWCKQCRVVLTSSIQWLQLHGVEPLWVLDDGRVAFSVRSLLTLSDRNGTLWMYDPRTKTCTCLAKCLKVGVGVYTGNLLPQVEGAQGMEEL